MASLVLQLNFSQQLLTKKRIEILGIKNHDSNFKLLLSPKIEVPCSRQKSTSLNYGSACSSSLFLLQSSSSLLRVLSKCATKKFSLLYVCRLEITLLFESLEVSFFYYQRGQKAKNWHSSSVLQFLYIGFFSCKLLACYVFQCAPWLVYIERYPFMRQIVRQPYN